MDKNYFFGTIDCIIGAYCAVAPFLPAINLLGLSLPMGILGASFFFMHGVIVLHSKLHFPDKIYALIMLPLFLVMVLMFIIVFSSLPAGFVMIYLLIFLLAALVVFYVIFFLISRKEISKFQKGLEIVGNGKYQEALDYFDNLLQLNQDDPLAWSGKSFVLTVLDKHEDALECSNRALDIKLGFSKFMVKKIIRSGIFNIKGIVLSNLKKYDEALECFDEALKLYPTNFSAWGNKGKATSKLGNYGEAIKYYNKALSLNSKLTEAWINKGVAFAKLEKYQEAIESHNKALEVDPELVIAWFNKGVNLGKLGKHEEAMECYGKVLELYSKQEPWELKSALRAYNGALETDSENAELWFGKGIVLGNLGENQEALECLDKALELNPDFEPALKARDLF